MGLVNVRVYSVDEVGDPLVGLLVQVYNASDIFVTQNTTVLFGAEAYADFILDGANPGTPYTIRMVKTGVAFDGTLGSDSVSPQAIAVYDPPGSAPITGTNYFQVQGQTFSRPVATDPRLCRASGFFRDAAGRPRPNLDIKFIPKFDPLIVDGDAVMGYQIEGCTDSDGYYQVDLFREGEYEALVEAFDDMPRDILVPDASSVNLINLLFPVVASVSYSSDPIATTVDNYVDVTLTVLSSSGITLDIMDGDVAFLSNDTSIATAELLTTGVLRVMGIGVGTTTVSATRSDDSIVVIPEVTLDSLTVTVS